jgi:hypothetical protein
VFALKFAILSRVFRLRFANFFKGKAANSDHSEGLKMGYFQALKALENAAFLWGELSRPQVSLSPRIGRFVPELWKKSES